MPDSTLKAALLDRLHTQADDRATRFILAQAFTAPLTAPALTVRGILQGYTFAPEPARALYQNGVCVQCALSITGAEGRFLVLCNGNGWQAECPAEKHDLGHYFIAAAQQRVENNRQTRQATN